jgi:hypothetical protein
VKACHGFCSQHHQPPPLPPRPAAAAIIIPDEAGDNNNNDKAREVASSFGSAAAEELVQQQEEAKSEPSSSLLLTINDEKEDDDDDVIAAVRKIHRQRATKRSSKASAVSNKVPHRVKSDSCLVVRRQSSSIKSSWFRDRISGMKKADIRNELVEAEGHLLTIDRKFKHSLKQCGKMKEDLTASQVEQNVINFAHLPVIVDLLDFGDHLLESLLLDDEEIRYLHRIIQSLTFEIRIQRAEKSLIGYNEQFVIII